MNILNGFSGLNFVVEISQNLMDIFNCIFYRMGCPDYMIPRYPF